MEKDKWLSQFEQQKGVMPEDGTILTAAGGEKVKIHIDLMEGKPPFMYALAYQPCIVGEPIGWFCRDVADKSTYGMKCILMTKARDRVIRQFGLAKNVIGVKSIKVIRKSRGGQSLLVEVIDPKIKTTSLEDWDTNTKEEPIDAENQQQDSGGETSAGS